MKFAMKSLVAAAMWAAAGIANAATVTANAGDSITLGDPAGSGRKYEIGLLSASSVSLTFSNVTLSVAQPGARYDPADSNTIGGLVSALNAGDMTVVGGGSTSYTEGFSDDGTRASGTATGKFIALTANDQTGQILSIVTATGVSLTAPVKSGIATGGTASVSNLRVDLTNHTVYADLVGTNKATATKPAITFTLLGQALWTFSSITGPTSFNAASWLAADPVAALTADGYTNIRKVTDARGVYSSATAANALTGLTLVGGSTGTAFKFFADSLGLLQNGRLALAGVNDWGRLDSTLQISLPVLGGAVSDLPEPSTYALMGLGLLGLAAVSRRRAQ